MTELRKGLPPVPKHMQGLPIDSRGYPIPWFVITMPNGTRDFRIADESKRRKAARFSRCWVCGGNMELTDEEPLLYHFVIGPMCAVNRNTSEPGNHKDCAEFAVRACPFMLHPAAQYRDANLATAATKPVGAIDGNPGVTCIWGTKDFRPYTAGPQSNDWLIRLGDPVEVSWWAEGRPATRAQVEESFARRLPVLTKLAREGGPTHELQLQYMVERATATFPAT